jgi:hypothetical protein
LREGKGGGGRAAYGPVRKRWSEAHGAVAPAKGGSGPMSRGKRDPGWAELGWSGSRTRPASGNSKENRDWLPRPPGRIEEMNRKGP